nr:RNA-directed DNA polymerase, eukaryota, reverse transcriptase zinc-binding domain protein [Tanacetum cinerariifolium]
TNLDSVLDRGEGIDTDVTRRSNVVRILQDIEKTEAMEVAQKAKIKWAVEGDKNSKYYHGVINKNRNNLAIRGVLVDGNWVESPQLVKNEFYAHFKQRFEKPNLSRIQFDKEFPNKICSEQAVDLEREVSKEEGVKWFFLHERIPSGGNSSFITLIPKVSNANMVKDFRPISLIGSVYKIVANILANRLVLVLGDLVSDTQSAFLKERQILDGPFILNEVIQWCKKKKKQSMTFKVDFEKAYDSVRWNFVDTILKKFGFRDKWYYKVRKSSWVSWNQVMASKDAGGLGVASLFALNRGLMFKWVWRFITQKNSLWAKVITAIMAMMERL